MAGKEGRAPWTGCSGQVLTGLLLSQLWFRFLLRNLISPLFRIVRSTLDTGSYIPPCRLWPSLTLTFGFSSFFFSYIYFYFESSFYFFFLEKYFLFSYKECIIFVFW